MNYTKNKKKSNFYKNLMNKCQIRNSYKQFN